MNLKLTKKKQVQRAHFSGKQQTLNDSIIQDDEKITYINHHSDDTNLDRAMSFQIRLDHVKQFPEVYRNGKFPVSYLSNCWRWL